jgi:hypothetical protein
MLKAPKTIASIDGIKRGLITILTIPKTSEAVAIPLFLTILIVWAVIGGAVAAAGCTVDC